jgi:hypothetical protein
VKESTYTARDPRLTREMSPYTREHPDYWRNRPSDHSVEGLLVAGPEGDGGAIGALVPYTHCAITAPTPEGQRRAYVVQKARQSQHSGYGLYGRPRKPANSGRKRKAA